MRSLRDVARSNRLFGGASAVIAELAPVIAAARGRRRAAHAAGRGHRRRGHPRTGPARGRSSRRAPAHDGPGTHAGAGGGEPSAERRRDRRRCLALPFADRGVDIVACSQLLHHFDGRGRRAAARGDESGGATCASSSPTSGARGRRPPDSGSRAGRSGSIRSPGTTAWSRCCAAFAPPSSPPRCSRPRDAGRRFATGADSASRQAGLLRDRAWTRAPRSTSARCRPAGRCRRWTRDSSARPSHSCSGSCARSSEWPAHLAHYRFVRFRERASDGGGIVEMAANRPFGPFNWPTWWLSEMQVVGATGATPAVRFRHIGGLTRGMEVEWRLEARDGGTRVELVHVWDGPHWPLIGVFAATAVIGPVFVHGIASRTLAGLARVAEREAASGGAGA